MFRIVWPEHVKLHLLDENSARRVSYASVSPVPVHGSTTKSTVPTDIVCVPMIVLSAVTSILSSALNVVTLFRSYEKIRARSSRSRQNTWFHYSKHELQFTGTLQEQHEHSSHVLWTESIEFVAWVYAQMLHPQHILFLVSFSIRIISMLCVWLRHRYHRCITMHR